MEREDRNAGTKRQRGKEASDLKNQEGRDTEGAIKEKPRKRVYIAYQELIIIRKGTKGVRTASIREVGQGARIDRNANHRETVKNDRMGIRKNIKFQRGSEQCLHVSLENKY